MPFEDHDAMPIIVSQSLTVSSCGADAICRPSPEKATDQTALLCPSSVVIHALDLASHSLTVLSLDADASCLPSGEKATAQTIFSCELRVVLSGTGRLIKCATA